MWVWLKERWCLFLRLLNSNKLGVRGGAYGQHEPPLTVQQGAGPRPADSASGESLCSWAPSSGGDLTQWEMQGTCRSLALEQQPHPAESTSWLCQCARIPLADTIVLVARFSAPLCGGCKYSATRE